MKQIFVLLLVMVLGAFSATGQVNYSAALHNDAQAGDAQSMADLGWCYAYGKGVDKDIKKAVELFNKAIAKGNTDAMRRLGNLYREGDGVPLDYSKAMEWYQKAADKGDSEAMYNLGVMYANGDGVSQNYAEALKWYQKAADKGDLDAIHNLGVFYENGWSVTKDYTRAIEWYKKAADKGHPASMICMSDMYYFGRGVEKNLNLALDWLAKRMEIIDDDVDYAIAGFRYICRNDNKQGTYSSRLRSYVELFNLYKKRFEEDGYQSTPENENLYFGLAVFYAYGVGATSDQEKAKELVENLSDRSAGSVCRAAEFYEFGDFGSVDYKKALEIYEHCTWDHYAPAKAASFYIDGKGTPKNISRALELIKQSKEYAEFAETTCPLADFLLGRLYYEGLGVKQNRAEAFKLFKAAAEDPEDPNDEAMQRLSACYRYGYGTTKDLDKAEFWLKKAQETGNEKARRIKELLGR